MTVVRSLVLCGFGINCEEETAAAWRLAGAQTTVAHLGALLRGEPPLDGFDILTFPGGFSFGDDLGAGKVLANTVKYRRLATGETLLARLVRFVEERGVVLGICNGFQALLKTGLLPNVGGDLDQEATLVRNDSGRFEDRWCECVSPAASRSPFLRGLERVRLPVRHGEGKLVIRDEAVRSAIVAHGLVSLCYCDSSGEPTGRYPDNPNGSEFACAALTDRTGRVLGLMPHPEAFLSFYNDPAWPELRRGGASDEAGHGLRLFLNVVDHVRRDRGRARGEP